MRPRGDSRRDRVAGRLTRAYAGRRGERTGCGRRRGRHAPIERGLANPDEATAAEQDNRPAAIGDRYLVAFRGDVADPLKSTLALANCLGFRPTRVYRARFKGFAARLFPAALAALRKDASVAAVYQDQVFTRTAINDNVYRIGGFRSPIAKIDGIDERVDADVAIVDGPLRVTPISTSPAGSTAPA